MWCKLTSGWIPINIFFNVVHGQSQFFMPSYILSHHWPPGEPQSFSPTNPSIPVWFSMFNTNNHSKIFITSKANAKKQTNQQKKVAIHNWIEITKTNLAKELPHVKKQSHFVTPHECKHLTVSKKIVQILGPVIQAHFKFQIFLTNLIPGRYNSSKFLKKAVGF